MSGALLLALGLVALNLRSVATDLPRATLPEVRSRTTTEFDSVITPFFHICDNTNQPVSWALCPPPPSVTSSATSASSHQPKTSDPPTQNPENKDAWTFNITIGNQPQHVGSWFERFMRNEMRDGLMSRCRKTKKWGSKTCSDEATGRMIEYGNKRGKVQKGRDAVTFHVSSDHIPEEYGQALQKAFIDQIAVSFVVSTNANFYKYNWMSSGCFLCKENLCMFLDIRGTILTWCNAPNYIRVAITYSGGTEKAHMRVDLKFDCPKILGGRKCLTHLGTFDYGAGANSLGGANGARNEMLKTAMKVKDVSVEAQRPRKDVVGGCPNEEYLYRLGSCFA